VVKEKLCTAFIWCVCDPDGDVFTDSARKEPGMAVREFMSKYDVAGHEWGKLKKAGYRCRQFRILEVEALEGP
jgi:hypothetical protein